MCVAWSRSWEENRPTEQNQRGNQNELQKITYLAIKKPKSSREGEGFNKDAGARDCAAQGALQAQEHRHAARCLLKSRPRSFHQCCFAP